MKAKRVSREEQLKLIMECRSSGLSDYQWCEAHGIHAGTFYNWVSKLRKAGVTIPNSESRHLGTPVHQEVVKVDLVLEPAPTTTLMEQNTRTLAKPDTDASVAMEIMMGNSTIRFFNNTMAKTYNLNLYDYLKFLFEHRPNKDMSDKEFETLAPWNEHVQELCK